MTWVDMKTTSLKFTTWILITGTFCTNSFSQMTFWEHNTFWNGDTINKVDQNGLNHGFYMITDNLSHSVSDTNYYKCGFYEHGVPKGTWKVHNKNGTFSMGEYSDKLSVFWYDDHLLGNIKCNRIGRWDYFTKDSSRIKSESHEHFVQKKVHNVYELDTNNAWILINKQAEQTWSIFKYLTFNRYDTREYFITGRPKKISKDKSINRYYWSIEYEYHFDGHLKSKSKFKYTDRKHSETIKTFSKTGKLFKKSREKYLDTNCDIDPNDFW